MYMKISPQIKMAIQRSSVAPAIIEIEPDRVSDLEGLRIPITQQVDFKQFDRTFISAYMTDKLIDKIIDLDSIKRISPDKEYIQTRTFLPKILDRTPIILKPGQIPTGQTRKALGGIEADSNKTNGKGIKYAVIDTGYNPHNPQFPYRSVTTYSTLISHGGNADDSGHGTWCISAIGGQPHKLNDIDFIYGMCPQSEMISIRTLFTPVGTGTSSLTLKAIKLALDRGVDIISMSLGSLSPTEEGDPTAVVIKDATNKGNLFCVAAGNSGPGPRTINSPGDVEESITIGSLSYIDKKPSFFSSRGPTESGLIKPDIICYGGGRALEESKPSESLISSSSGLLDLLDGKNQVAALSGTSMATPIHAGLLGWWQTYALKKIGRKLDRNEIQEIYSTQGTFKNHDAGYGLATYEWIKEYFK